MTPDERKVLTLSIISLVVLNLTMFVGREFVWLTLPVLMLTGRYVVRIPMEV
jgi:hypothetical protein